MRLFGGLPRPCRDCVVADARKRSFPRERVTVGVVRLHGLCENMASPGETDYAIVY